MILHHLTHGQRFNLPYLIIRHMIAALKDTSGNGGLPYSLALTKIFKEFKLSFIGEEATENLKPFNCTKISHLKVQDGTGTLGLHQIPLPQEAFLNKEEENPLFSLVNDVIVESHLSSQSASLDTPKTFVDHFVNPAVSTDLKLSIEDNVEPIAIPTAPLFNCENSALFGSSCLNRFLNSPKNDNPLLSDIPPIPSHFSSFDSFKSIGTSPKNDPPIEPACLNITNEMLFSEIFSLRSFMFQYFGLMAPAPSKDPGSSSNPPPNQQ
ncbi:uncharacterized protein [Medicago truncatula]|nr:uncharacterized protein LOC25479876 isoform X1 [Medicago truncatula]XP_039688228.1 uncharacterized protein LOC25479876 isoform X1 [Medicago truncatula]XP_039688229.1 uncharacterized protein LOC25479876 isoform X1 [Medicago truncatula]XP_039688230.1 uncharacterized protein LOC25479876 isoform X1 [Medicago truncatula]